MCQVSLVVKYKKTADDKKAWKVSKQAKKIGYQHIQGGDPVVV